MRRCPTTLLTQCAARYYSESFALLFYLQSIRGLKTMSLRMERQQANAQKMADWLTAHPLVTKVNYPVRFAA